MTIWRPRVLAVFVQWYNSNLVLNRWNETSKNNITTTLLHGLKKTGNTQKEEHYLNKKCESGCIGRVSISCSTRGACHDLPSDHIRYIGIIKNNATLKKWFCDRFIRQRDVYLVDNMLVPCVYTIIYDQLATMPADIVDDICVDANWIPFAELINLLKYHVLL